MRKFSLLLFVLTACGSMCSSACGPGDGSNDGHVDASSDGTVDATFTCDPVLQTGCAANTACYSDLYLSTTGDPAYHCAASGTGMQRTNCNTDTDCAAGFWCLKYRDPNDVLVQICSQYCRTGVMGCPGSACIQSTGAPFGYCL